MAKKIALINSPRQFYENSLTKDKEIIDNSYPIGLLYVSSALKNKDYEVSYLDANFYKKSINDIVEFVNKNKPEFVGMNIVLPNMDVVLNAAKAIKEKSNTQIILGGPGATLFADELIKHPAIDYTISGEGERTIVELLKGIENNELSEVKGVSYKAGNEICTNERREQIQHLDDILFPDVTEIPKDIINKSGTISMFTTRGCPSQCTFCSTPKIWERKVRMRSTKNIIDEIKHYEEHFDFKEIHFLDDTFTLNKRRLYDFIEEYKANDFDKKYSWRCLSRVNTIDEELAIAMKESGCYQISFGIESGSPKVLKDIKKGINLTQAKNALRICKDAGIKTKAFFMIGFPSETPGDIKQTLDYACSCGADDIAINVVKAYPGTEMYESSKGLIGDNFSYKQINFDRDPANEVEKRMLKY
ncbi:MAG: B12-binding domain-containing radical SAM protein, partial [Nanoarchaeota archaeon]|nr:B12-binding domain-containing radical SAM protein [Nanoarchaeota archaeon]